MVKIAHGEGQRMCRTINHTARAGWLGPVGSLVLGFALAGCDAAPAASATDAGASPNAQILPAPLATEPPDLFDAGSSNDDGARAPSSTATESFRASTAPPADPGFAKEAAGVALEALFRWRDVPAPPRAPEVSADAHRDALKATGLTVHVDLVEQGRLRFAITGSGLLLPARSELRARMDHVGNLLVWPNGAGYRAVPAGAMRALLGERRVDVSPLSPGTLQPQGDGKRLGLAVRKIELRSSVATVRLELAHVAEAGDGGPLLCRLLVELGGVDPRSPACLPGEVPLLASYAWQEGGGITFEVSALVKHVDTPASALLAPPPGVPYLVAGLPAVDNGIFLSREALAALRSAALPATTSTTAARDPRAPGDGFVAANQSDRLMILSLDGIPVVWVPPYGEQFVVGPLRGRYVAQWRTFLGEKVAPAQPVEIPARLVYGGPVDGGAPPDGG
jgi:hypothetical protein